MNTWSDKYVNRRIDTQTLVQSAGAVEYTDCFSVEW